MLCSALKSDANAVPVDDFFGDYVEQLGARGLQQDVSMNGENVEGPQYILYITAMLSTECHKMSHASRKLFLHPTCRTPQNWLSNTL